MVRGILLQHGFLVARRAIPPGWAWKCRGGTFQQQKNARQMPLGAHVPFSEPVTGLRRLHFSMPCRLQPAVSIVALQVATGMASTFGGHNLILHVIELFDFHTSSLATIAWHYSRRFGKCCFSMVRGIFIQQRCLAARRAIPPGCGLDVPR